MDWCGQIYGQDRSYGTPGAARLILVGDPGEAAQGPTGPLIPEGFGAGGPGPWRLAPLGALSAPDRLALIGFQHLNPHWDGVAVAVGEHATVWATLSAREVIHQQGSATPRLAAALGIAGVTTGALEGALDRPERLPLLLQDAGSPEAELGALLGAEIGATRTLWLGQQAVLIGEGPLAAGYGRALDAAHVPVTLTDRKSLHQKGFEALAQQAAPGD